jgi:hypothetical protein
MITGAQIRASLSLLGWSALELSERTRIAAAAVIRAEAEDGPAAITIVQETAIRRALRAGGIEFLAENGGAPGVRLRTDAADARMQPRRKRDVIVDYLNVLQKKLKSLRSGDTEIVHGADAIQLLFPPGASGADLPPRAEAIISAFAESCYCDYDYEPGRLRFIRR